MIPQLAELVKDPARLWVGHNIRFDLHFLLRHGIRPDRIADTMVAQWMVDENMELKLKRLAYTRLGYPDNLPDFKDLQQRYKKKLGKKRQKEVSIFDLPIHVLGEYGARDTRITFDLWQLLVHDLEVEGMTQIFWETEMAFAWVLQKMEAWGVYIDQHRVTDLEAYFSEEIDKLSDVWKQMSGGVNPNSTPQLRKYLFETLKLKKTERKTDSGLDAVDDLVLMRLAPEDATGSIKLLRELRKFQKLMSTYVGTLQVLPYQDRLHCSLNHTGTVTGRLSASDPNLQNIPARSEEGKKIRETFAAAPGFKLLVVDYSQIELRVLASESKEENFLKIFREGGDPHQMTADLAHVKRSVGKTVNFGWAYGVGPRGLCDQIEKAGNPRPTMDEARAWLNNFNAAYPILVHWKDSVVKRARKLGYVPTLGGRKRRLPDLNSHVDGLRYAAERQCVNARIQGSCADMIKWSMLQLDPWCDMYGARMLLQVHDELVLEVPEEIVEDFAPIVRACMESIQEKYALNVNVIAEPGIGVNWAVSKH